MIVYEKDMTVPGSLGVAVEPLQKQERRHVQRSMSLFHVDRVDMWYQQPIEHI